MKSQERELVNNAIQLSGEVATAPEFSHEVFGEGFYTVMLSSQRTSGTVDTLPVTVSERLVDLQSLEVGMRIAVSGQIRTFNKKDNQGEKPRLVVSVFAQELEFIDDFEEDSNEVCLTGYLCKMPIHRTTPLGREICDILVAVNRPYGKSDYIPAVVWGRNASYAGSLGVGAQIELSGRLQSRKYNKRVADNGDGTFATEERTAYELSIGKLKVVM